MTDQQIQEKAYEWGKSQTGFVHDKMDGFITGYNEAVRDNYSEEYLKHTIEAVKLNCQKIVDECICDSTKYDIITLIGLIKPDSFIKVVDPAKYLKNKI